MPIYYLAMNQWLPDEPSQYIFMSTLIINTGLAPCMIQKCNRKQCDILNPMINSSYSSISIYILIILKITLWIVLVTNIINIAAITYC